VPPGFEVAHISRPSFARLAQFDLGNDLRWGFRNDMHLCISYDFKKSGTTLSASIYKGTRNSAEKELAFWQQHVSRENSTIIEAPSVGDQSLAWEEGGLEGELKALVFAKDRFLVQIYAAPAFEDSPAPSWGDLDSLAHTVEDRLR
jgi:hypothetical protein